MPFDHTGFVETDVALILKDAKARISKPELWCQGESYIDDRVCAVSAIMIATGDFVPPRFIKFQSSGLTCKAIRKLQSHIPYRGPSVTQYNDAFTTTHEDVMAWFDRAIESC